MTGPNRRTILTTAGAGVLATAMGARSANATTAAPASASASASGSAAVPAGAQSRAGTTAAAVPAMSRATSAFLNRGLLVGAWIATEASGRRVPTIAEWNTVDLDVPVYYDPPFYSPNFMGQLGNSSFGVAQWPTGNGWTGPDKHTVLPGADPLYLPAQGIDLRPYAANLFTLCIGDEEQFSSTDLSWKQQWFAAFRNSYPNVVVHSNQWPYEWTDSQMANYITTAYPDLLTYDNYPFVGPNPYPGGNISQVYDRVALYRNYAITASDDQGRGRLEFGHYPQGYMQYNYTPSESELCFHYYVLWAMGGKWNDLFRWEDYNATTANDVRWWNPDGSLTHLSVVVAEAAAQSRALSPYLVRLYTKSTWYIGGQHLSNGTPTANDHPQLVGDWATGVSPYIASVTSTNTGGGNNGLPGDVMIGFFDVIPGVLGVSAGTSIPGNAQTVLGDPNTKSFMILNGLYGPNTNSTADSATGLSAQYAQNVTVTLNRVSGVVSQVYKVDRSSGALVTINTTAVNGNQDQFTVSLPGGQGDLVFVTTGPGTFTPASASGNLALGRPTTASGVEIPCYAPANATDGAIGTRWSSPAIDNSWIQVDLGSVQTVNRVVLVWEPSYGKGYQIQMSTDGKNWTTIYSTTTGAGGTETLTGFTGTGQYIRMYGTARATQWGYSLYEFQVFDDPYVLVNRNSGKAIDDPGGTSTAGTQLIQYTRNGGPNQSWRLQPAGAGIYNLVNVASGLVMDVTGGNSADGTPVIQWTSNGGNNQQWQLADAGGGYVNLVNVRTGKAVGVTGSSTADLANLEQETISSGATNQQWQLISTT